MKKSIVSLLSGMMLLSACGDSVDAGKPGTLLSPTDVTANRTAANQVTVTWKDNSTSETGYAIMLREASTQNMQEIGQVAANVTSFEITDVLEQGKTYMIGVKAFNKKEQTRVVSVQFNMIDYSLIPTATLSDINSGKNCIWGNYTVTNYNGAEWGLCWSADGEATIEGGHAVGPELSANGSAFQVIPNTLLDYDKEYSVRAYIKNAEGVYYSAAKTASMTQEYPAITLQWNKVPTPSMPASIEVYSSTTQLNGHAFQAWYAIADLSKGEVDFRVNLPSSAQTIDQQAATFNGDCYIMVNGGYFYNGRNTGLAIVDGKVDSSINPVRGSLLTSSPEYNEMYNATRGIFGVDANNKPGAYWAGTNDKTNYYFSTPIANVVGENKYGLPTATFPAASVKWTPKNALSAGPLLLIDGKIPFDFTTTAKGSDYYLTNYEVMAYDIFGANVSPDRTAAGYTVDGKIILFICDGRIAASGGATLLELAQIMKGLGCVGAVNFDGGGSTGMMVGDKHINDLTANGEPYNRPVVSTMGFFKKK